MYKYILESSQDINWMALFALITFFAVFGISAWLAIRKDKDEIERISSLPLDID